MEYSRESDRNNQGTNLSRLNDDIVVMWPNCVIYCNFRWASKKEKRHILNTSYLFRKSSENSLKSSWSDLYCSYCNMNIFATLESKVSVDSTGD